MKKRILVVAFYFSPFNRVGVRRMTHLVDFLRKRDVDVTVLKGDNRFYGRAIDTTTPAHPFSVIDVRANHIQLPLPVILNVFTDYFFWNRAFRKAVEAVVKRETIDAILLTGGPFFYFTVGTYIRRKYGIPYILDFRDPWLAGHHEKLRFTRPILRFMESKAIGSAELVFDVTSALSEVRKTCYPHIDPDRFMVFANGYDENLVDGLALAPESLVPGKPLTLGIWGKFSYYSKIHTDTLFAAMARLKQEAGLPVKLKFLCDRHIERYSLQSAVRFSLEHEVEFIEYGGYRAGMRRLAGLDCLILNHRSPLMTGTKIYDYLFLNKPIIAFARQKSAIADILSPYENAFIVHSGEEIFRTLKHLHQTRPRHLTASLEVEQYSRYHAVSQVFPTIKRILETGRISDSEVDH